MSNEVSSEKGLAYMPALRQVQKITNNYVPRTYSLIKYTEDEILKLETKIVEHKQAILSMVEFKNRHEEEITRSQSVWETRKNENELHIKCLAERGMGCLSKEISQLRLEMEHLWKRRNQQKRAILRAGQKVEELQQEHLQSREALDSLLQNAVQREDDYSFLMECMQQDERRTVNELLLGIKKQSIEARRRHEALDKEWERTAITELEWERTEEAICQLCKEWEELSKHWKTTVSHMTKRHQDMDQCIVSLSVVKEGVEERREVVKMVRETLESLWQRNVEASRWLEAVCQQMAEMKAGYRARENQSATLHGECEILRCAIDRANTEVKNVQSILPKLTTDVYTNKDRLDNARLHSAALVEKLSTEMELVVRAKEVAEWAELEVKKEEQASKDADASFYGHQEVLSRKAEELQALKRAEKEQLAVVSTGRGTLSKLSCQQREMDMTLIRKKEAENKQDSQMELLERRMQELSAGEGRKQVEHLKEEEAKISMVMEEKKSTIRFQHGEQQKLEVELRLAKRAVEKLVSERQDLSCKVEDLELLSAANERELSAIRRQRRELMVKRNLLKLEVKQANDRLQTEKDRVVALEKQRLMLVEEFQRKKAELNLQMEAVQRQMKKIIRECQKTRVEQSRQRCKVQKLQKKHQAIAVTTICVEGEEVSLQQYKAEVKSQQEELKQQKEDLNRKLAAKQREVAALKSTLSAVRENCEERKGLEQTLCAMQDQHAESTSQIKELKKHIQGMNRSLDELLHEEREVSKKHSLLQDLRSEIHVQEKELSRTLKLCSELTTNIWSARTTDDETKEEEDMERHDLQEFSETVEMLLLEVMDKYPEIRSVLQALFMKRGLALDRTSLVWDCQQSGESVTSDSWDSSSRGSIKTPEQQDTKPVIQVQGSPCQLTNHQHDSGWGSTDACSGSGPPPPPPKCRDSSTPSDGSSLSSNNSRAF